MAQDNLRAVILTAISTEFKAVRTFLSDSQQVKHPEGNVYQKGIFKANNRTWTVGIAQIGKGDAVASLQTERAISYFDPHVIFFVGVAGGLKDVDIGDVVVSTKIYGYEFGKAEKAFKTRSEIGLSAFALEELANAEVNSEQPAWLEQLKPASNPLPNAYVGPIAAGEKVIASKESSVYQLLSAHYSDALAVEMEGFGFLLAVQKRQRPVSAIVVRGISDLLENKNDDPNQPSEKIRQAMASRHASAFAFQLLANFEPHVSFVGPQPVLRKVESEVWDELFSYFQESELPIIAPLCQEAFEDVLTPEQRDPYPELSQLDTLQKLRTVFERRDDLSLGVTWVRRVIHEFENSSEEVEALSGLHALQGWYNIRKPSQPEAEPEKKSPGYLLIALDPQDDEDNVAFTAELHNSDGTIDTSLVPPGAKCSIDQPSKHLSKAINKAGRDVKTVEFFLSWQHFDRPVHEWQIPRGMGQSQPLKWIRSTLVRSLDRLTQDDDELVDEWLDNLQDRWKRLQDSGAVKLGDYCHEVEGLDCQALGTNLLQQSRYLMLKFLSVLPEDRDDLRQLLGILLESGIPIWCWLYNDYADTKELSEAIDKLLALENLQEPATLANAMREERGNNLPDLGLLCDCPARLPVLVDWKNGRLRQPTVESPMSA
ncbi:5'-methylthioadenosine/S-adenosylhomocysteine nucleosidase [Leptolyngbya cf. ectocarpi LEGE 11479]|uniref:5'-methylthioadenosine/S-adenosylhomocysteine nucleosidase n=1 Tax=Leptolyngbya cf. ectocarpi LEGE 11479 TaxID=1828722 RepID=A0A928WZR5_LEPEC|nr:5'-methylthioadenosine/S-adenosylhomocysteine nucleosidase [Leptolyngbya ectocarpi]MBE9065285.1 5'-methylthioadenosine/S-adenosylhomocysteine nucleosidase [Leptolyngbya cf. ectocarpi LEGE 11479]